VIPGFDDVHNHGVSSFNRIINYQVLAARGSNDSVGLVEDGIFELVGPLIAMGSIMVGPLSRGILDFLCHLDESVSHIGAVEK